jgi:hypothetical protein
VPLAVTEHRVKLLEILKGASAIGTRAELVVAQDTVEASASRMGVPHKGGGGLFKPAEEYVLFLEPLPGQAAFAVVWGGGGSFRLLGAGSGGTISGTVRLNESVVEGAPRTAHT